jgi:hypothetical protein
MPAPPSEDSSLSLPPPLFHSPMIKAAASSSKMSITLSGQNDLRVFSAVLSSSSSSCRQSDGLRRMRIRSCKSSSTLPPPPAAAAAPPLFGRPEPPLRSPAASYPPPSPPARFWLAAPPGNGSPAMCGGSGATRFPRGRCVEEARMPETAAPASVRFLRRSAWPPAHGALPLLQRKGGGERERDNTPEIGP